MKQELYISGYNNLQLFCTRYDVPNAKGIIVVVHGMQEHSGRYELFAKTLNDAGYSVVLSDSRGHGKTITKEIGYGCGEKDIFSETVIDQQRIIEYVAQNYPNLPIYLFAHSYGSMIAQRLIQVCPAIKKAVLCGTACGGNIGFRFGAMLGGIFTFFGKKHKSAKFLESLIIGGWGKKWNGNWLSRDDQVYKAYLADPLCGGSFPYSFYISLFKNMNKVNKTINQIAGDTKILLIVGSDDPVGGKSKQVKKLHKKFCRAHKNSQIIVYPSARHELINELNKKQVYADIINFYNN